LKLVMVGDPWTDEMQAAIRSQSLADATQPLTNVQPEDLRALYACARALIFPSLHEGFGWPVIEAQACGCPVLASNRDPIPAIAGDSAVYFDPENEDDAARIIAAALRDTADLRERGLRNASRYSTSAMISAYQAQYADIAHSSANRLR